MKRLELTEKEHLLIETVISDYIWKVYHKEIKTCLTKKAHQELRKLYEDKIMIDPFSYLK